MDRPEEHDFCVLDIETSAGDFRMLPAGFKLLFTGIRHRDQNYFYPSQTPDLLAVVEFLDSFQGTVVTFNGKRFDVPVLNRHLMDTLGREAHIVRHYDILWSIVKATGYRISLAELARLNLGRSKRPWDNGLNEAVWRKSPSGLLQHNQEDLELTAAIYELILRGHPIRLEHRHVLLRHID